MKSFDETYADHDFTQQIAEARAGWMAQVPLPPQPDLRVEGLDGSLIARVLRRLTGGRG
jgi:hypothetical protein